MTVKLGLFTMPFHHPDRDYGQILAEDQEAIVLADRLGFTEAFVGEHFSSWSERITSPLIFFATPDSADHADHVLYSHIHEIFEMKRPVDNYRG